MTNAGTIFFKYKHYFCDNNQNRVKNEHRHGFTAACGTTRRD